MKFNSFINYICHLYKNRSFKRYYILNVQHDKTSLIIFTNGLC